MSDTVVTLDERLEAIGKTAKDVERNEYQLRAIVSDEIAKRRARDEEFRELRAQVDVLTKILSNVVAWPR